MDSAVNIYFSQGHESLHCWETSANQARFNAMAEVLDDKVLADKTKPIDFIVSHANHSDRVMAAGQIDMTHMKYINTSINRELVGDMIRLSLRKNMVAEKSIEAINQLNGISAALLGDNITLNGQAFNSNDWWTKVTEAVVSAPDEVLVEIFNLVSMESEIQLSTSAKGMFLFSNG